MLAFNTLGNNGRLGNQMFQFAALRGIAAYKGYDFCIPPFNSRRIDNYSLSACFKLSSVKPSNLHILDNGYAPTVIERYFEYDKETKTLCPNDVSIHGFFQTEKYFDNIKDSIREDFTFHDEISAPCKEFMDSQEVAPLFLHVRRGNPDLVDARGFKWAFTECSNQHPPQTIEYYIKALKEFPENQPVIVVSDSPEWCQEQELFKSERFLISEPEEKYPDGSYTPYVDLCLMSLCSGAIIANSSLSWWGAWLQNGRGKVVAPKNWFGIDYKDKNTEDLYCPEWIVI